MILIHALISVSLLAPGQDCDDSGGGGGGGGGPVTPATDLTFGWEIGGFLPPPRGTRGGGGGGGGAPGH